MQYGCSLLSAGAILTAASALPAKPELQKFFDQLAAVKELSTLDSAQFLQLGNNACFPQERKSSLLVRQCYLELSQILLKYLEAKGHTFIITGNPGIHFSNTKTECWSHFAALLFAVKSTSDDCSCLHSNAGIGKSLFLYYLMWLLVQLGRTFVWDRWDATSVVLLSPTRVCQGPLLAFTAELDDSQTW